MWNLPVSSDTSASPHTSRSNLVFSVPLSAGTLLFEEDGLFWSDSSFAPPIFFVALSCLPFVSLTYIYRLRNLRGSSKWRPEELLARWASVCCLTLPYTFFFILISVLTVPLLPEVFLSSSLSKCEESNSAKRKLQTSVVVVVCIGWLHVLCVPILSTHSLLPRHWDSIPALTVM